MDQQNIKQQQSLSLDLQMKNKTCSSDATTGSAPQ